MYFKSFSSTGKYEPHSISFSVTAHQCACMESLHLPLEDLLMITCIYFITRFFQTKKCTIGYIFSCFIFFTQSKPEWWWPILSLTALFHAAFWLFLMQMHSQMANSNRMMKAVMKQLKKQKKKNKKKRSRPAFTVESTPTIAGNSKKNCSSSSSSSSSSSPGYSSYG